MATRHDQIPAALREPIRTGEWALYLADDVVSSRQRIRVDALRGLLRTPDFRRHFADSFESLDRMLLAGGVDDFMDALATATHLRPQFAKELEGALGRASLPWRRPIDELRPPVVLTPLADSQIRHFFPQRQVFTLAEAEAALDALSRSRPIVVCLFGEFQRPDTVCFTPAEFDAALASNVFLERLLTTICSTKTVVVVGTKLDTLEQHLRMLPLRRTQQLRRHVAIVHASRDELPGRGHVFASRHGVTLVNTTAVGDATTATAAMLKDLARVRRPAPAERTTGPKHPPALRRVILQNIGPFRELTFNFSEHVNVILGDNSAGKTTLLKAIALGIGGPDLEREAAGLVRTGAPGGRIVIETANRRYVTELVRHDTGVRVTSRPGRPLELENWLVLGFPAVRIISGAGRSGSSKELRGGGRPTADDVLPLLRGGADPRIESAKEWLLEMSSVTGGRPMTETVLAIADRLVAGFNAGVGSMNPDEGVLNIRTPYGEVPIEAMSQGSSSLFGMLAVLLKRLLEYGTTPEALQRPMLLLIDEVDAHMHPRWQQRFVAAFAEAFPRVQLVATTHSPLTAASVGAGELQRLVPRGDSIEVIRPEISMKGWRSDQTLTSGMFGLESSRDPETQAMFEEFAVLAMARGDEERERLEALAHELRRRVPTPFERETTRFVFDLANLYLAQQIEQLPAAERAARLGAARHELNLALADWEDNA